MLPYSFKIFSKMSENNMEVPLWFWIEHTGKLRSAADLDKGVVPDRVNVQVVTQAEERGEDPTKEHP